MRALLLLSLIGLHTSCAFISVEEHAQLDLDADGELALAYGGADCDDTNADIRPGASEICDGVDNNCNDAVDENLGAVDYFLDADGDGFASDDAGPVILCEGDDTTGYTVEKGDCDDGASGVLPGAEEDCGDGIDNDCDGTVDETDGVTEWYVDADGDGYGDDASVLTECPAGSNAYISTGGDCDDSSAEVHPGRNEVCGDLVDDDCSGLVDDNPNDGPDEDLDLADPEDNAAYFYRDADEDTIGTDADSKYACAPPVGYVEAYISLETGVPVVRFDCDDDDKQRHPLKDEICNGIDDDCDGDVDDADSSADLTKWAVDADNDGFAGEVEPIVLGCDDPSDSTTTYISNLTPRDCDDANANVYPKDDEEFCDGADDNCDEDGLVDEGFALVLHFQDMDSDGLGSKVPGEEADFCNGGAPAGWVLNDGDCNDSDGDIGEPVPSVPDCDGDGYVQPDFREEVDACSQGEPHPLLGPFPDNLDQYCDNDDEGLAFWREKSGQPEDCDDYDPSKTDNCN